MNIHEQVDFLIRELELRTDASEIATVMERPRQQCLVCGHIERATGLCGQCGAVETPFSGTISFFDGRLGGGETQ